MLSLSLTRFRLAFWGAACAAILSCNTTTQSQQLSREIRFKTDQSLKKTLGSAVSISQKNQPVRKLLESITDNQQVAIFLDRRIDPGIEIDLDIKEKSLEFVLFKIADQCQAAVIQVEDVIYIGPLKSAARFYFEYRDFRKTVVKIKNSRTKNGWVQKKKWSWSRLATPQSILERSLQGSGLKNPAEKLPYDLWPEGNYPSTSLIAQICLVSTGFELIPVIHDSKPTFKLASSSFGKKHKATYRVANPDLVIATVKEKFPQSRCVKRGKSLDVTGDSLVHCFLRRAGVLGATATTRHSTNGQKVVSLNTEAAIGDLLNTIARRLNVKLELGETPSAILSKRIKLAVEKVTYEKLITRILDGTGLKFQLTAEKLVIGR